MISFKYLTIYFSFSLLLVLLSCSDYAPVEQDKLVRIYSDMLIMQDSSSLSGIEIQNKVLKVYDVSISDYQTSIEHLKKEPERWQKFYDSVVVHLQSLKPIPKPSDVKTLPKRSLSLEK